MASIRWICDHTLNWHTITGHGLHQIHSRAALFEQALQALAQKLSQLSSQGSSIHLELGQKLGPVGRGPLQPLLQIQAPAFRPQDLQHAIAGAAQGIGIGRTTGALTLGVDAQQQFQALRQGHHGSGIGVG